MTALAIDLWDKRCGIAVEIDWFSMSKDIVARTSIISAIKTYSEKYNCDTLVVGLPYDLYWKNLKQLEKTKKFISKLEEIFPGKKIVWFDERFTSFEADNILKEFWIKDTRGQKDDISAQIILENYIEKEKNKIKNSSR